MKYWAPLSLLGSCTGIRRTLQLDMSLGGFKKAKPLMDSDEEVPVVTRLAQFNLRNDENAVTRINYDEEPVARVAKKSSRAGPASCSPADLEERKALQASCDRYLAELEAELKAGHIHVHIHTHAHTLIYIYIYIPMCVGVYAMDLYVDLCTSRGICIYRSIYVYMHVHTSRSYRYVYMENKNKCVYMKVSTHIRN